MHVRTPSSSTGRHVLNQSAVIRNDVLCRTAKRRSMNAGGRWTFASHRRSRTSVRKPAARKASSAGFRSCGRRNTSRSLLSRQAPVYAYTAKAPPTA